MKCALACLLLLTGVMRHLLWEHAGDDEAQVWNLCGAVAISVLLLIVWRQNKGAGLSLVILWFLYEEALVGICSAWRIVEWWPVAQGEEQCSAKLGFNVGAISLVVIGALVAKVSCERRDRE